MNADMVHDLQLGLAQRDEMITKLMARVDAMELQAKTQVSTNAEKKDVGRKVSGAKKNTPKGKGLPPQVTYTPPNANKAKKTPPAKKTPTGQRARSATPISTKKSPHQMTKQDHPAGFENTKEALYVHIKILWGLIVKGAIPKPPSQDQLRAFYQRFQTSTQIESAIDGGPQLVGIEMIETLKKAREQRTKVGKGMLRLSDFNIRYIHSSLSKLGLVAWVPNLDEQADSLYNVAHKIAAVRTFRECVASGAYAFMNANQIYTDNLDLLMQAYEHYVHFNCLNIYSKEKKEEGKHTRDEEKKVLQTARERLRDRRYKFAINNNFPKRYIDLIKPVQAHSDDEYFPAKEVYVVKKLPYRSEAANIFFRRLDEIIKQSEMEDGKRIQARRRVRVKNPSPTIFPKAPKGLPLDFYDADWFNEKLPAQRQNLANLDLVAFLKNPLDSFKFKDPNEKLSNGRFVENNWDRATKNYNLDFLVQAEPDSPSEDEDDSDYGGSIDLENTDGEDDDDEGSDDGDSNDDEDNPDADMQEGGSGRRRVDENYEEFDDMDRDMNMEDFGRGTYTGGLADNEWNAWQQV